MGSRIAAPGQREEKLCLLILLAGAALKLCYAIQVPYSASPHDLGGPSDWVTYSGGHLSYIQYLYQLRQLWQGNGIGGMFYHPPLFHTMGALIFGLFYRNGSPVQPVFEWIQLFNTLSACAIAFVGWRILKHLEVKGRKLVTLTAFLSFGPTLYWLGTALTNDCLMTLLQAMTIEQIILWAKKPQMGVIIKAALLLALAMLTKTSAVLIAPAIGCVFLYVFLKTIQEKGKIAPLMWQLAAFLLISVPLGCSYVLRNWHLFQMPLNYVAPGWGVNDPQYIGDCTLFRRLGLPSLKQLFSARIHWDAPKKYCNIWWQTFLTMALDEGILVERNLAQKTAAVLLVWSCAGSTLVLLAGTVRTFFSRRTDAAVRLLLGVGYGVVFLSYVVFAFRYPRVCTMNTRYIYITMIFLVAGYGLREGEMPRAVQASLWGNSLLSTALYFLCAV